MAAIDWIILCGTILFIVIFGVYKTRKQDNVDGYLRGNNEATWWTVGLSVMATQASAITFLSTPGQAFHSGMSFVQFYFGLPLAMVVICLTFIPIYHKLKVYTAYEYLESRFDLKTRGLTAILFLIQRGMGAGLTIYAPAIILSSILGWNLTYLNIIIGILVIIYTVSGGTKAVNVTQKQQMAVIMLGMFITFFYILSYLPEDINFTDSLAIAGASGKMNVLDFSFDLDSRYTVWSGITGGFFLALAYFGTDQSQVQRYLSGRSIKESRMGLIMNGLLKVPLQFFILLVGVMVFVFYQFHQSPVFFNPAYDQVYETTYAEDYKNVENEYDLLFEEKSKIYSDIGSTGLTDEKINQIASINAQENQLRGEAKEILESAVPLLETNDKDYVFISFILKYLPQGLIGLLLAMILSAAMSSTASELNALGTTTSVDIYRRMIKKDGSEKHYLLASKALTMMWGLIAIGFACIGTLFENLIQFVNIIGSLFYGTILGVFIVGFYIKYIKALPVFIAAILTEAIVIFIFFQDWVGYLWLNLIGCVSVVLIAMILQSILGSKQEARN